MVLLSVIGTSNRKLIYHSRFGSLLILLRYPRLIYAKEGQAVMERLWNETMEELRFASGHGIDIQSMIKKVRV